jgi:hypothetical protein
LSDRVLGALLACVGGLGLALAFVGHAPTSETSLAFAFVLLVGWTKLAEDLRRRRRRQSRDRASKDAS